MRLTKEETTVLKNGVKKIDPDAQLYIFGSRLDDDAKASEIDLIIVSKKVRLADKLAIDTYYEEKLKGKNVRTTIGKTGLEGHIALIIPKAVKI